jgi:hypothetical protein
MLTGRPPLVFAGVKGIWARLALVADELPPPVEALRADCPPRVATLVADLLAKSPAERPESAAHVRERLAALREELYPGQRTRLKSASDARGTTRWASGEP